MKENQQRTKEIVPQKYEMAAPIGYYALSPAHLVFSNI
jgi:hypothetical protein